MTTRLLLITISGLLAVTDVSPAQETLASLNGGAPPKTHRELWADYDPRTEPLEVEVLHEWEEDGVELKVLRYRVGIFKGQKAMMAGVYGHPKGKRNLPGLVQIHGGGQYADYRAPLTNAKRGYATLSISWAGRIHAPDYKVTPTEVRLFWDDMVDDPRYRVTTDWGALDAYHAPTRSGRGGFGGTKPSEWTLDPVESPRNESWFLCTLGARRALTFLEEQREVDPSKLGVYGHSMGGKLTVLTAGADPRVKAAVPSCGGISDRSDDRSSPIGDGVSLEKITCPILFQSPANDFHGRIDDLQTAVTEIQSEVWRVTCSAHHNHQDTPRFEAASQMWFDQHLKGQFSFPKTPQLEVNLKTPDGIPEASIEVDNFLPILDVEVYYTRHGQLNDPKENRENTKNRFWHYAEAKLDRHHWRARLPVSNTDQPLWVYANVTYALEKPVSYAGYYYRVGSSETVNLSSLMYIATPDELQAAGTKATLEPSLTIETFEGAWEKEWFTYRPDEWGRSTHKIYDERWKPPIGARLAMEVRAEQKNSLVVGIDTFATTVTLKGGQEWQEVVLAPDDFKNWAEEALMDWQGVRELRLSATESLRYRDRGENKRLTLGKPWNGSRPQFRNLRWVRLNP